MPNCTVRYHVRLLPKVSEAMSMDAIAVFTEERMPNERGEPGMLLSRHLDNFSGPGGDSIREMVTAGEDWQMDVQDRIGPLEWDSTRIADELKPDNIEWHVHKEEKRRRWFF